MVNREEFFEILNSIQVSNISDSQMARKQFLQARDWILNNIPDKLYRFFNTKTRNLEALSKNEIWGSRIDTFNDIYESTPCYDYDACITALKREFSAIMVNPHIESLKQGVVSETMRALLDEETINQLFVRVQDPKFNESLPDSLEQTKAHLLDFIENSFLPMAHEYFTGMKVAQMRRAVACFSEERDATLMWAHYAESHCGFCVEYNFHEIVSACLEKCEDIRACANLMLNLLIAPVFYSETRFDATSFLLTIIQNRIAEATGFPMKLLHQDMQVALKCLLVKSSDWNYEREWRLISSPTEGLSEEHKVIANLKPSAIYMGAHTKAEIADQLELICKEKEIPLYKMIQTYTTKEFSLIPMLYEDFKQYQQT